MTGARLEQAGGEYAARLAHLPKPRIAVVIGGNSGPYTFGARAASRLCREACALARETGGSLLVTTSSRTPGAAAEALAGSITVPAEVFLWRPDAEENPYFAFLSLADRIIVTGDSIAMLSEACSTGKPVYIFDLGTGRNAMQGNKAESGAALSGQHDDFRVGAILYRLLMQFGPRRLSRDLRLVHQWLVRHRYAVWLGEPYPDTIPPPLNDIERAVAEVKALLATPDSTAEARQSHR